MKSSFTSTHINHTSACSTRACACPQPWTHAVEQTSQSACISILYLCNAADQLQRAVEVNEYAEAARLLEAVQQLSAHFQSFVSIPKVAELGGRVSMLQRALQVLTPWGPEISTARTAA